MQNDMDITQIRSSVLVVDDEPQVLAAINDTLEGEFRVFTETSPRSAIRVLENKPDLSVIISDQRMPGMSGHEFLAKARELSDATRILITGFSDLEAVIAAVNEGKIFGYISKPWDPAALKFAVLKAAEFYALNQALHEREERLRQLVENIRDAFWIVSVDTGKGIYISPAYEQIWGRTRQSLREDPASWIETVHPEDRPKIPALAKDTGEYDLVYRIIRPDGSIRWIHDRGFPVRDAAGNVYRFAGISEDITERKRFEEALYKSERLKDAIITSLLDCLITIDHESKIIEFNPAAEATFGYSRNEVLGKPMAELIIPPRLREAHYRGLARYLATGEGPVLGKLLELTAIRADGTEFPVELSIVPIRLRSKPLFIGCIRDITERKAQEQKIARLSRIHAVLSGINSAIVRIHDRQALFDEACRIAVEHGQFKLAWVGMIDEAAQCVTPVAIAGENDGYLSGTIYIADAARPDYCELTARTVERKAPVICNDITTDPVMAARRDGALQRGFRSIAAFPLRIGTKTVGVIVLYAPDKDFFDEQEVALLEELAGDVSFALEYIEKEEQANYLAYYDALTGLSNRALFLERLNRFLEAAQREKGKLAVLMLDLQRFKTINDTLGRQAGDALIRQLAERLKRCVPDPVQLARVGADQFAIAIPYIKHADEAAWLIEGRIKDIFEEPFRLDGEELLVSANIGIAVFPNDGQNADTLFLNAETAVKKAKRSGERYLFFDRKMSEQVAADMSLESKLRLALEHEEFVLHYQPKIEINTGQISGLEALIRWQSPELGLVPPMRFIPLLEEIGLILEVGVWALERAVADYLFWKKQALLTPRIAVNISAIQLRQKDFVKQVQNVLQKGETEFGLDLEITESLIIADVEDNIGKLKALKQMGVNIAIDDFGTGYSSLRYIARLPVNALKIDRSFIVNMTQSPEDMTIVSSTITLGHNLNLRIIAEGVDSEEQARLLRLLKCDEMQGYLISKPLPPDEILELIRSGSMPR